jgi:DNA polymerase-3 subunit epsilon
MSNQRWVIVDVETTGYNPNTDRVLSVAAITLRPDGTIEHTMSVLLNPGVDPGPTDVHGLTTDILAGAPQFEAIAADLAALLDGRILVAHNAAFDYGFLAAEFRRTTTSMPTTHRLCTVELASKLNLGLCTLKLSSLAKHYRISQLRPHDALDDARVLAGILTHLLKDSTRQSVHPPIAPARNSPETVAEEQQSSPFALPLSA